MKPDRGTVPAGRPMADEDRPPLRYVGFLAPPEVMDALEEMKAGLSEEKGAQSIIIRRAILNELARYRSERTG